MIDKTWILTANSAVARFFVAETNNKLKSDLSLTHPGSRLKEGEIVSDAPGRQFSRQDPARRSAYDVEAKKHEAELFARQIGDVLEKMIEEGRLKNLYISASPEFLGDLLSHIPGSVKNAVRETVDKDLTHQSPEKVREHFPLVL
jgi:protein required for attachment to host cells